MSRVVHFEIQADNLERAKAFYEHVFGWTYVEYGAVMSTPYWGVVTGPEKKSGINGGLLQRSLPAPEPAGANAFVCTIQVEDYDATEARIISAGGRVATPKFALAGMAWQGYYLDTEGNTFGIHQTDSDAA